MKLDRAFKFGLIAAIGIILISLGSFWLIQEAQSDAIRQGDATATVLIIWASGIAINLMYLFTIIGEYLDRELEDRGVTSPE